MAAITMSRTATRSICREQGPSITEGSLRSAILIVMTAAALTATCLFHVWSRTAITREGYAISEVGREIQTLTGEQERLKAQAAGLSKPERIESMARRMGLVFPAQAQIRAFDRAEGERAEDPGVALRKTDEGR